MSFLDPVTIIQSGGLLIVGAFIFAESGLLIGFFLPGDTLLLTAGVFAAQGKISLLWLLVVVIITAVAGDNLGYSLGRKTGNRIFKKKDGILFRQEYVERAEEFYEVHGGKTITLARFVPIIRTFAPVIAGVAKMERKKFMIFNVIGAVSWGIGVILLGFFVGSKIPNIDSYLLPAVLLATFFTFTPAVFHILRDRGTRRKIALKFRESLNHLRLKNRQE